MAVVQRSARQARKYWNWPIVALFYSVAFLGMIWLFVALDLGDEWAIPCGVMEMTWVFLACWHCVRNAVYDVAEHAFMRGYNHAIKQMRQQAHE